MVKLLYLSNCQLENKFHHPLLPIWEYLEYLYTILVLPMFSYSLLCSIRSSEKAENCWVHLFLISLQCTSFKSELKCPLQQCSQYISIFIIVMKQLNVSTLDLDLNWMDAYVVRAIPTIHIFLLINNIFPVLPECSHDFKV